MMVGLPVSTEFNKRIPKQKFYANLSVTPTVKRVFVEQIAVIYWRNKIAAATVNVAAGKTVTELEVFELRLNQPSLDTTVLQLIDREIPYHILFILTYEDRAQAWIGYKEAGAGNRSAFKVTGYYHTEWLGSEELNLKLQGLDMDAIYGNLVKEIAGKQYGAECEVWSVECGVKEAVERQEKIDKLKKQIAALEKKIKNEKQFNRQVEMNEELKKLRGELRAES